MQFGVISNYKFLKDYKLHLPHGLDRAIFCL